MGQPRRLGKYRLISQLGSGGMAVVYRAVLSGPHGFERPVAVKCVRPELATDSRFAERFLREARLSSLLRHRGIVQIHELGDEDGVCFIAMELVDGHSLVAVLDRCRKFGVRLPLGLCVFMVSEMAAALDYVHTLADTDGRPYQIVHRDISPSNVMLGREGSVKLLDFGIAKAVLSLEDNHTRTGSATGKFRYFSPEQARGQRLDGRSDLFALGSVLYECVTLRAAFPASDQLAALEQVKTATYDPMSMSRADTPPELEAIVARMMALDPNDRFQRGADVVRALAPLLQQLTGGAHELAEWLTSQYGALSIGASEELELERPATRPVTASEPTSRPWRAIALVTSLLLGGGGLTLWRLLRPALHHAGEIPVTTPIAPAPGLPAPPPPAIARVEPAPPTALPRTQPPARSTSHRRERAPAKAAAHKPTRRSSDIHDPFAPGSPASGTR